MCPRAKVTTSAQDSLSTLSSPLAALSKCVSDGVSVLFLSVPAKTCRHAQKEHIHIITYALRVCVLVCVLIVLSFLVALLALLPKSVCDDVSV